MRLLLAHILFALTWGREPTRSLNHALSSLSHDGEDGIIRKWVQALLISDDRRVPRWQAIWALYRFNRKERR